MAQGITIDYKYFNKAGFEPKSCGIVSVTIPNNIRNKPVAVHDTASGTPVLHNQYMLMEVVTFTVEFVPFVVGNKLLAAAGKLVRDVREDKYEPAPFTLCIYNKEGAIDTKKVVNDAFIQSCKLLVKPDSNGQIGAPISIRFTLQGLYAGEA